MKNTILCIVFLIGMLFFCPVSYAQQSITLRDSYSVAQILRVQNATSTNGAFESFSVNILNGIEEGKRVDVQYDPQSTPGLTLHTGDTIIIAKLAHSQAGFLRYYFVDKYRLFPEAFVIIGFIALVLLLIGWKGIGSLVGLFISLCVIFFYIVPQIIAGMDPLTVCIIGSVVILFLTTYVAHGVSKQTTVALLSTLIALFVTFIIALLISHTAFLSGYGDQNAGDLHYGLKTLIDLKGLFLGGIILATLGALNDITVTQSAAVFALHKTNPTLSWLELITHGFPIGREHAISLINTLVLAYAGSALAMFILFLYNPSSQPLWVILNNEFMSEEIMKTITGTTGLLLAVPLATILAAYGCQKKFFGLFPKTF